MDNNVDINTDESTVLGGVVEETSALVPSDAHHLNQMHPETRLDYDSDDDLNDPLLDTPGEECVAKNVYEGPPKCKCCINWVDEYPDDVKKVDPSENAGPALIIRNRKTHGSKNKPLEVHEILVQSECLKDFLRGAIPKLDFKLEKVVLKRPFEDIFHHWDQLKQEANQVTDAKALDYIRLLLNVLRRELKDTVKESRELISKSLMTFKYLWTLYKPGDIVFNGSTTSPQMYKVARTEYDTDSKGKPVFDLRCFGVDWDGKEFGKHMSWQRTPSFDGIKKITDLRLYPQRFIQEKRQVRDRLLTRGRTFSSLAGSFYRAYRGTAIETISFVSRQVNITIESSFSPGAGVNRTIHVDGRVMIDAMAYYQYNTSNSPSLDRLFDPVSEDASNNGSKGQTIPTLTEEQLLLCVPTVKGYVFAQKSWVELSVDNIMDIGWNQDVFKNLILPTTYKDLVLSFVESQLAKQEKQFDDFVEGKGQGVVMLLAGAPGIGKTLTAESVAEEMHAPLYSVTAGELGSSISEVEESLGKILDLAARWKAVLLLDEADVYLASRTEHDIERNKLVSIFLRMLEYYQGVLFITTNRAGSIDAAFKSRIHLSLEYPSLTRDAQKEIWRNFIDRSPVVASADDFTAEDLDGFANFAMNGREIKNAIKLAHLLAGRNKEALRPSHIQRVLRTLYPEVGEDVSPQGAAKAAVEPSWLQKFRGGLIAHLGLVRKPSAL
ncbi:P-loop containing nucleoside triphosphate hydrolase protein [Nemania sp. FL0031]|nr:P-loop containing nucleoside triphosphate hydrolase protein [Nemania sp. FL0031]